jgi:hypothetical protein
MHKNWLGEFFQQETDLLGGDRYKLKFLDKISPDTELYCHSASTIVLPQCQYNVPTLVCLKQNCIVNCNVISKFHSGVTRTVEIPTL